MQITVFAHLIRHTYIFKKLGIILNKIISHLRKMYEISILVLELILSFDNRISTHTFLKCRCIPFASASRWKIMTRVRRDI